MFTTFLAKLDFISLNTDFNIFLNYNTQLIITLYIDNILITSTRKAVIT